MFNLEQSITDWRQQMLTAGIKSPVPLEELEIHLREEIEREMRSGLSLDEQEAFNFSVLKFGKVRAVGNEFKKSERTFMKRTLIILLGIFAVLFGPAIFLPALALHNHQGVSGSRVVVPMAAGIIIALIGVSTVVFGFKKRKA